VRDADFIILGGFEGFAQRLRDSAGSQAQLVEVQLENSPKVIHTEVLRLAHLFGTTNTAKKFLLNFDQEYAHLKKNLHDHFSKSGNRAVAQVFMTVWADFAGLELVGTFGPGPLQPGELLHLSVLKPNIVLDNAHMATGTPIAEAADANLVQMINFPRPGMDLLDVFRENARVLIQRGQ
jgi:zinc transport system substrate-binding protein